MSISRPQKIIFWGIPLAAIAFFATLGHAADGMPDTSTQNLVAGFGTTAISNKLMNTAPENNANNIVTEIAQTTYLNPANSLFIGQQTRNLLSKIAGLGKDQNNDVFAFVWSPTMKPDPDLNREPLKSIDANILLEPVIYNDVDQKHVSQVLDALSDRLSPLETINFAQLVAGLSGDKNTNLKAKLNEKQTQEYLAVLRSYLASETIALGNLYELYTERQAIDSSKISGNQSLKAIAQLLGSISPLRLENYMATRRMLDQNWNLNLIKENPATLQREQLQLMAENLAEAYRTRMTLERLLATMSILTLEFNQQSRTQLKLQTQNLINSSQQNTKASGFTGF